MYVLYVFLAWLTGFLMSVGCFLLMWDVLKMLFCPDSLPDWQMTQEAEIVPCQLKKKTLCLPAVGGQETSVGFRAQEYSVELY